MASIYENQGISLFGNVEVAALPKDFDNLDTKEKALVKEVVKDLKGQINKSTNRIIEKVKEMHQISPRLSLKNTGVEVKNLHSSSTKSLSR